LLKAARVHNANMKSNRLIVFEGIDGAGKATQVELLRKRLVASGKKLTVIVSPRYDTPTGKIVKRALEGEFGNFVALSPYLSGLPYLLDFAAERDELVKALEKGMVICDRYISSTLAYHSAKLPQTKQKAFLDFVENLVYRDLHLPKPDLFIYLDVPVSNAQRLMKGKKKDQHEKDVGYQKRVADAYNSLAKRKDWRKISCTKDGKILSPQEIHEKIWKAVQ
jgi:dTMP kinase